MTNKSVFAKNITRNSTSTSHGVVEADVKARVAVSIVLMIIIIIGNLLVILAYKKNHRLRTGTYTFLVSLAMSDFLVGSVALPLWIYVSARGWRSLPQSVYTFYICFDIFSALASTFHLTAVTVERFIAISRPFYYKTIPMRSYFVWICVAWSLAFLFGALHPRIILNLLENPSRSTYLTFYKVHGLILFICGYLGPMMLIATVNIGIFKIARKLIRSSARPSQVIIENDASLKTFTQRRLPKERKTAITLVMITGLFFTAWMPFFIVNMLSLFCLTTCFRFQKQDLFILVEFTKWFHYSNSAINAVVYAFRDVDMRRTFISLVWPCCLYRTHRIGPGTELNAAQRTRNQSCSSVYYAEYLKSSNRVALEVPECS